ncbi:hypothetical protein TAC_0176 [Acinetobacter phage TAC1]|uniref:hypothetical protein n=1 Tax=Acinetobacter baumannii TaxID=470 RepID=UPI0010FC0740|nr:hypothetical protein TAC_0176 [Acinetobacter phage TAC1]
MTTLNQAVNGELVKGTIALSQIIRESDFFMDDIGNRYSLQMSGDADIDGNDEYALHDCKGHIFGYIIESDMMDYTVDCAKNITKVRICGLWLLPYKHVPVKLI